MKKLATSLLTAIILILTVTPPGQAVESPGEVQWSRTFGGVNDDYANSVQKTRDGGYIIVGVTHSYGAGGGDVYLIKTDINGNMSWNRTFGGIGYDYGLSVKQTPDGGYIIVGQTNSFGAGSYDVYLIKTDATGNISWSQTFGGSKWDMGFSVDLTRDGGYIIVGETASYGFGDYDVYLIKTDASGNMTWSKTFGGSNVEEGWFVRQTDDDGYIVVAKTGSYGVGGFDVYLIKTDANGNVSWNQTFGGSNNDYGFYVQQTSSNNGYIVTGMTNSFSTGSYDVYLVKTDANGNMSDVGCQ